MGNAKSTNRRYISPRNDSPTHTERVAQNIELANSAAVESSRRLSVNSQSEQRRSVGHLSPAVASSVSGRQRSDSNCRGSDRADRLLGSDDERNSVSQVQSMDDIEEQVRKDLTVRRKRVSKSRVLIECESTEPHQLELTRGDVVDVLDNSMKQSGWIWCRGQQGEGWVPEAALGDDSHAPAGDGFTQSYPSTQSADHAAVDQSADVMDEQDWSRKLKGSMVVHSMQNIVRLSQYIVDLLHPYGAATSVHIACWRGSIDAVEVLATHEPGLIQKLHAVDGQLTPLHIGVICGYSEVVSFLLDMKANCNVSTVHALRPLHLAASNSLEMTDLLLSAKAVVNARDADDTTPLMFAACYHQQAIIPSLLEAGAICSLPNRWGVAALHVLCAYSTFEGGLKAIQLLISSKADPWLGDNSGLTPLQVACRVAGDDSPAPEFIRTYKNFDALVSAAEQAIHADEDPSPRFGGVLEREEERDEEEVTKKEEVVESEVPAKSAIQTMLQGKNTDLQEQVRKLEKDLEDARKQKTASEEKLSHAQETIESYQKMLKNAGETRAEDQNEQIQFMKEQIERLEKQCEAATKESDELRQQHNESITELKRGHTMGLEQQVEAANKEIEELKKAENGETKLLKQKIAELMEAKKSKDQKSAEKSQEDRAQAQVLDKTKKELEKIKKDLAKEKEAKNALQTDKTTLEKQEAELAESVKRLETALQKKTTECSEKSTECAELRKKIQDLMSQHSAQRMAQEKSQNQAEEAKMLLDNQLADAKSALAAQRQELDAAVKKIEEMESYKQRAEHAEEMMAPLAERNKQLEELFEQEQKLRKKYHNQLQDLKGAIRVYCRVRPKIAREKEDGIGLRKVDAFTVELETAKGKDKARKQYVFDSIFDEDSSQEIVFKECADLIQSALDGFNVTIFAYGQTGAGKTHTMYGSDKMPGLVPRTTEEIFRLIDRDQGKCEFQVRMYMLELYCNDLQDLLMPKKSKPAVLEIKRDHRGSVYVENVTEVKVSCASEIAEKMDIGFKKRHVSATKMNSESSRSHLIVSILISARNAATKTDWCGKITLCDLAGSERLKKSEATGEQMKEAVSINKSLTALGDVIEALTANAKHVPYRNHKLTELMSDSLGGNAKTLMFVNCSPAGSNATETSSSLGYATRAKQITNQVSKQVDNKEVARLKQVIAEMSKQNMNKGAALMPDSGQLKQALGI